MIAWSRPLGVAVDFDPHEEHPWAVVVNGYVQARCTHKSEAQQLKNALANVVPSNEPERHGRKKKCTNADLA